MGQSELIYDIPSYVIAVSVFCLMVLAGMVARGWGKRVQLNTDAEAVAQASAVQGSLLGLLALLLGFTFSLSLSRFDERSVAVVHEANTMGTAYLRSDLISEKRRDAAKGLLRQYGDARLAAVEISAADHVARAQMVQRAAVVFDVLWQIAADEAREFPTPVSMGFAASLNDMIDALSTRNSAIDRHVPELVLFLLFGTFVVLGAVIGFSSAISGVRPGVPVYAMTLLIAVLVFLIIDLDRPRRGLIAVDQSPLAAAVGAMQR
ncbi:hypothetical protein SAMN05216227_10036 [Pseudorhodobacter antarcticus]|uniref:DUF4239 domain-containing protein n=1 Tax=Pseudorhodobacter antarcticus TaxID=1077947 RepID=A0A1H8BFG1_9RHOB|nr:hypothetical protein [Pseudorhodobacter antarcticus]SEM81671.1 hypothetical protein SAMN05216227_10036 [Pseudorhodobacter antarcticus]